MSGQWEVYDSWDTPGAASTSCYTLAGAKALAGYLNQTWVTRYKVRPTDAGGPEA